MTECIPPAWVAEGRKPYYKESVVMVPLIRYRISSTGPSLPLTQSPYVNCNEMESGVAWVCLDAPTK